MPVAQVRGVGINHEVVGDAGPWVVLTGGGRMDLEVFQPLAEHLAAAGCRVVIHDRRNCGASDIAIAGNDSEEALFADDTYLLLEQLGALPVVACGGAAGSRLSLLLASRYPEAVRGLLLWWPTGGRYACERLAQDYYGQFIEAARSGGMGAVCATPNFGERIARNAGNRGRLLSMSPDDVIRDDVALAPILPRQRRPARHRLDGSSLRAVRVPACVVPGHDDIHPRAVGERLSKLPPQAELHYEAERPPSDATLSRSQRQKPLADIFIAFLRKRGLL